MHQDLDLPRFHAHCRDYLLKLESSCCLEKDLLGDWRLLEQGRKPTPITPLQ